MSGSHPDTPPARALQPARFSEPLFPPIAGNGPSDRARALSASRPSLASSLACLPCLPKRRRSVRACSRSRRARAGAAGVGECPCLGWRGACWEAGDTAPLHDGSPRRLGRVTSPRVLCFSQHEARDLPQLRLEALWEAVGQDLTGLGHSGKGLGSWWGPFFCRTRFPRAACRLGAFRCLAFVEGGR